MSIRNLINRVRNFTKDQGGMEALQTVCIVAIAATILIAAATVGSKSTKMMNDNFGKLQQAASADDSGDSGATAPAPAGDSQSDDSGTDGGSDAGSSTDGTEA
jgi:hypothetical protein